MNEDITRIADSLAAFAFPMDGENRQLLAKGIRSLMDIAHAAGMVDGAQTILARFETRMVIEKAKEKQHG